MCCFFSSPSIQSTIVIVVFRSVTEKKAVNSNVVTGPTANEVDRSFSTSHSAWIIICTFLIYNIKYIPTRYLSFPWFEYFYLTVLFVETAFLRVHYLLC